jgi:integrase/recombinase XerD
MPIYPARVKFLTQTQTTQFFSVITDPRDRALFATIYHYGLRVTEATLLQLEDIDLIHRRITIHRLKGGYGGERPFLSNTAQVIQAYLFERLATGSALFTGRQGNLHRQRIQQLFKWYAQIAGIGPQYTVRCLRHSIGTHLLDAGFGIEFVQDHLGHVNIQNTLIYAKLTNRRREAVYLELEKSPEIVKV